MAYIYYLTHIHLGFDTLATLPAECERIGIARPLIITDSPPWPKTEPAPTRVTRTTTS